MRRTRSGEDASGETTAFPAATGIGTETLGRCPVCDGESIAAWCTGFDRLHDRPADRFVYSRCRTCDVLFESTRPVEEQIFKAYPSEYAPHRSPHAPSPRRRRKGSAALGRLAGRVLGQPAFQDAVRGHLGSPKDGEVVLDYGCGAGKFLDQMARRGCRTIGIDFSPQVLEIVRRNGHEAYLAGEDAWRAFPDGSIDLVRMNHVVEHLYEPRAVLRTVLAKMRPQGRLHIAVPNPDGLSARLFRSMWHGLDCPRHVILYPPRTLVRLLEEVGFENVRAVAEPLSKDFVRSWGYLAYRAGLLRHARIEGLIHSGSLQLAAALPCRIAARVGMADRFQVVARRPAEGARSVPGQAGPSGAGHPGPTPVRGHRG